MPPSGKSLSLAVFLRGGGGGGGAEMRMEIAFRQRTDRVRKFTCSITAACHLPGVRELTEVCRYSDYKEKCRGNTVGVVGLVIHTYSVHEPITVPRD